jgi:hypothetical protein
MQNYLQVLAFKNLKISGKQEIKSIFLFSKKRLVKKTCILPFKEKPVTYKTQKT